MTFVGFPSSLATPRELLIICHGGRGTRVRTPALPPPSHIIGASLSSASPSPFRRQPTARLGHTRCQVNRNSTHRAWHTVTKVHNTTLFPDPEWLTITQRRPDPAVGEVKSSERCFNHSETPFWYFPSQLKSTPSWKNVKNPQEAHTFCSVTRTQRRFYHKEHPEGSVGRPGWEPPWAGAPMWG